MENIIQNLLQSTPSSSIEVFEGVESYIQAVQKRTQVPGVDQIRQICNGDVLARFHELTNYKVKDLINDRVVKKIPIKILVREQDKNLEIEKSNPDTLKESRMIPAGNEVKSMITTFGEYTAVCNMNESEPFGIVIKDKNITQSFVNIFDMLWSISKPF